MAGRKNGWIRRLPSGLWAATVRVPGGDPPRITESFELRSQAEDWAAEQRVQLRRGEWLDPRAAEITIGQLWDEFGDSRQLERASRKRDESHWRCHVSPRWARVPAGSILKPDVTAWIVKMQRAGAGAATIEGALGLLRAILEIAVDARKIRFNPASDVSAPPRPAHLDRVLTPEEDLLLLAALDRLFPGRSDARLAVELMLYVGLRWEEMGALDREHVDLHNRLVLVGPVLERDRTIRPYPKSPAGKRRVEVAASLWPRVRAHVMTLRAGQLLVSTPTGKVLDYSRWHDRVWSVALLGRAAYPGARGHKARPAVPGAGLGEPQPTPHDLRHTFATRLGEQGVSASRIMYTMGHESLATSQRYIHDAENRHEQVAKAVDAGRLPYAESS